MRLYKVIIPNLLSFLRLVCAVAFPFCSEHVWIWLVVGAGISDILDGYLARRWQVESWQGGLLDGVSDNLFGLIVLATFVSAAKFSIWWVPVILARDLVVAGTAICAGVCKLWSSFQEMEARWLGKVATGAQFLLFIVTLLLPEKISIFLWLTASLSILAACDYGYLFLLALRERMRNRRTS